MPPNVWLGVSIENADCAWRADALRKTSATVKFLSLEPLLAPIGFGPLLAMQWVIVGGESGAGWRPMDPEWARYLRNRCREFEIPFFFKQVSGLHPTDGMIPKDLRIREYPHVSMVV